MRSGRAERDSGRSSRWGSPIGKQGEEGECKAGEGGRGLGQEAAEVDFLWR